VEFAQVTIFVVVQFYWISVTSTYCRKC